MEYGILISMEVKRELGQNRSLRNAVSGTSENALLVTSNTGKSLDLGKFHNHSNYVLMWKKSEQLAGKATKPGCHQQLSQQQLQYHPYS